MVEGHFTRHLRRMRTLYAERRAALLESIRELPLEIDATETGLHCVGWLPAELDEVALVRRAAANGLILSPVSTYSIEPLTRHGLVLGYAAYSVPEIQDAVRRLAKVIHSVCPPVRRRNKSGTAVRA